MMGFSSPDSKLLSLDEYLKREQLPSEALTTYLTVVLMMMRLRDGNRITFCILKITRACFPDHVRPLLFRTVKYQTSTSSSTFVTQLDLRMNGASVFCRYLTVYGTLTIHKKNLQKLMVEIYKTINHLNPPYMWDLFTKKVVEYDFRIKILCELPPARSQRFGTNSLIFKGSLLWNSLSDDTKTSQSLAIFKQKIRSWDGAHCTCNICRN